MRTLRKHLDTRRDRSGSTSTEVRAKSKPLTESSFGEVTRRNLGVLRAAAHTVGGVGLVGTAFLLIVRMDYASDFAMIAAAVWGGLVVWTSAGARGVPLLPILLLQQGAIFGIPLLVRKEELDTYSASQMSLSCLTVAVALVTACAGWYWGVRAVSSQPARYRIDLRQSGSSARRGMGLAISLLGFGLLVNLLSASGLIWSLLGSSAGGVWPVIRTFAGVSDLLGATIGGIMMFSGNIRGLRVAFWIVFFVEVSIAMHDLLLSGATSLMIGALLGLTIGRGRVPWKFLVVAVGLVAFLNFGKAAMREKYWKEGNTTEVSISQLPAFYLDWANQSLRLLDFSGIGSGTSDLVGTGEEGQSILTRLGNLGNLAYVIQAQEVDQLEPLHGQTYTLIPALLVPRLFWPDKPRTHEGQILLNLHYGRQASEEETERTYIAWGLLPEAVGNFGPIGGALFFGLVTGFICGCIEAWSGRKRLFSIEGLLVLALLMQLAQSFEMVASVLVTSTFQLVCVVLAGGYLIHFWLSGSGAPAGRGPGKTRRPPEPEAATRST